jgi:hypothetical protein
VLFLVHRFLSPWWRRRHVPPKRRFLQEPHGVTTQKTPFFIVTAVKTSNLPYKEKLCLWYNYINFSSKYLVLFDSKIVTTRLILKTSGHVKQLSPDMPYFEMRLKCVPVSVHLEPGEDDAISCNTNNEELGDLSRHKLLQTTRTVWHTGCVQGRVRNLSRRNGPAVVKPVITHRHMDPHWECMAVFWTRHIHWDHTMQAASSSLLSLSCRSTFKGQYTVWSFGGGYWLFSTDIWFWSFFPAGQCPVGPPSVSSATSVHKNTIKDFHAFEIYAVQWT